MSKQILDENGNVMSKTSQNQLHALETSTSSELVKLNIQP